MLFAKTVVSAGPPSPFIARSISLFVQGERGASCHFCYSKFQILQCLTASNGGFSGIGAHPSFMKLQGIFQMPQNFPHCWTILPLISNAFFCYLSEFLQ
ncbi:hypothetical protein OIU79_021461 [Salix purpurea]|uniref:Uncharacterized protein n=1 Tax=Salix purpurea TaxID=77065 RepID=A0A9Q0WP58_SALPP|nr:hypothetical protein OIU79_021461 [Salix purpurea]